MYNYKNKEDLIKLISDGNSTAQQIANKLGINVKTVLAWLNKYGLIFNRTLVTENVETIKEDITEMTSKEFSSKYRISKSRIPTWKRILGVNIDTGAPRYLNKWEIKNNIAIGYLSDGSMFTINTQDYENVKKYTWRESSQGYIETSIKSKRYFLHRVLLFGLKRNADLKNNVVDHINMDKRDNRRENLRIVTNSINQYNRKPRKDNTSGVTGISYLKRDNLYRAQFKSKRINDFKTLDEAIKARKKAEEEFYNDLQPEKGRILGR